MPAMKLASSEARKTAAFADELLRGCKSDSLTPTRYECDLSSQLSGSSFSRHAFQNTETTGEWLVRNGYHKYESAMGTWKTVDEDF